MEDVKTYDRFKPLQYTSLRKDPERCDLTVLDIDFPNQTPSR